MLAEEDPTDTDILSTLSETDIRDRGHSAFITKVLTIVQSGWLVIQSIARLYRGLATSQLELNTMAFIICTVVMYGF